MRSTITISLPKEERREIDRVSAREGLTRSEIVRESVRDYLFIRRLRALRRTMLPKAARRGIYTDQDVFNKVS
jgi:metal-responsive CopG/Arc/MetJ family transcriptional regulator